jgi:hypothetical protein
VVGENVLYLFIKMEGTIKKAIVFIHSLLLALVLVLPAQAGEVDILVEKLMQKGILSKEDAGEILREVRQAARQEREAVVKETAETIRRDSTVLAADLPAWIKNTRFSGDLRLRYQMDDRPAGAKDRHRGRYRLRLGFTNQITDDIEIGFGLTSGPSNPKSANQDMVNSFETPDIRLDYAYATWRPTKWMGLTGGKFKNPLWLPNDLLWDTDIRPEGVSLALSYPTDGAFDLFMNAGFWIVDERSDSSKDPTLFVVQPGYRIRLSDRISFKHAVTWYDFMHLKGTTLDYSARSNTLDRDVLRNEYDVVSTAAELAFKNPAAFLPYLALHGEYVHNTRAKGGNDDGLVLGMKLGHEKVRRLHDWQVELMYRRIEQDAFVDAFPDGDHYGGRTGTHGYEFIMAYGLKENVALGIDYYYIEQIRGNNRAEQILQLDLNIKF